MSTENLNELVDYTVAVNDVDDSFQGDNDEKLNSNFEEEILDDQVGNSSNETDFTEDKDVELENNNAYSNGIEVSMEDTEQDENLKENKITEDHIKESVLDEQLIANEIDRSEEICDDIKNDCATEEHQINNELLTEEENTEQYDGSHFTEENVEEREIDDEHMHELECKEEQLDEPEYTAGQLDEPECREEQLYESESKDEQLDEPESKDEQLDEPEYTNEQLDEPECKEEQLYESECKDEQLDESEYTEKQLDEPECIEEQLSKSESNERLDTSQFDQIQEKQMNGHKIEENSTEYLIPEKPESPQKTVEIAEKVSEARQSNEIKALSSSYNNDDIVNSNCEICTKVVYPLEKISENNRVFHKQCFRCTKCRCSLSAGNFTFNNDKPYCRVHFIELFKKRGRYDEVGDYEATAQQANINDILTDELPAPDITKNLLAKFRDLEACGGSSVTALSNNPEVKNDMPAPNTTRSLTERFSALAKDNDHDKKEQKRKPMIDLPRAGDNAFCENEPACPSKDVLRASEPGQDEMPEQGITKNLVNRFRGLESAGVVSK